MIRNLFASFLLLGVSVALAKDSVPATKPAATQSAKTVPTALRKDAPATKPSTRTPAKPKSDTVAGEDHFPTPAESMEKIKAKSAATEKLLKVAHFDLSQPVIEKSPDLTLFGDSNIVTTHGLIQRLHRARDDKSIRAVLITLSANSGFNSAQALEIKNALAELRRAGKRSFVYADAYDTPTYLAASGATDVCLLEGGEIEMFGVDIEPMFLKGLFDKFGVQADFIQIGEFKGADEMYTRTELSEESKGELNKLADSLYDLIVTTIARNRNISKSSVKGIIDDVFLTAKQAKDRKLVDHLLSQDDLRDLITDELHGEINLMSDYAAPQAERLDFSNPLALLANIGKKTKETTSRPAIALIHADGEIVDGDTGDNLLGGGGTVGSENIRKAFRMASRDENVKAIVLRIDSPGGSALASEVMWQAVHAVAEDKPVIISVGSMAASGGYYLASAGDHIFADPSAIVGSIGVVGGKFVVGGIFDKLGITTQSISRGQNANINSMAQPWSDRQRRLMTNMMKSTYEQFTQRVMTNRKDKIKDIDKVARGRIFLAPQAQELGLIDEIGGLTEAISYAAGEVNLKEKDYDVKLIPGSRSILDLILGRSGGVDDGPDARLPIQPKITLSSDSPLNLMPPAMRRLFMQQLQTMQLLEKRPVILLNPYVITVK